jgi:hypothetical protein
MRRIGVPLLLLVGGNLVAVLLYAAGWHNTAVVVSIGSIGLGVLDVFVIQPLLAQSDSNRLDTNNNSIVLQSANQQLSTYRAILGVDNEPVDDGITQVKLTADGELQLKTLQAGMDVYHLRGYQVAVSQGHDTLCTLSLGTLSSNFTRAQIPAEVMQKHQGTVHFSYAKKPEPATTRA